MATKIRDMENTITGIELNNNVDECYFVLDEEDGLSYNITREELIKFIKFYGIQQGVLGSVITRSVGGGGDQLPHWLATVGSTAGIVKHFLYGSLVVEAENDAFNKTFSTSGGNNGTTSVVARQDHTHAELASIANEYGSHTAVFSFTGLSSHAITKSMLLDKMKYTPTKSINPAIVYTMWIYNSGSLIVIEQGALSETITTALSETVTGGTWREFSSLNFPSLSTTKQYQVAITFTDDRGLYIPNTGSSN